MFHSFAPWLPSVSEHFLAVTLGLLVYVLTARGRRERRAPASAMAWVMALLLIPYAALPAYLVFGQRKLRPAAQPRLPRHAPAGHWATDMLESFGLAPPSHCAIRMHADGTIARSALLAVIDAAQQRLDVCTFIIGEDTLGREVLEQLARRAREGVQVRVLLDGFGALQIPRRRLDALRAAGAQVRVFRPLFSLRRTGPRNLRNHRKFTLADDQWLWSGGRNLAGEYFEGNEAHPRPWLDLSFDIRGDVAAAAARQFEHDWSLVGGETPRGIPALAPSRSGALAQLLPSGPDQREDTAQSLLVGACFRAERRILAITPYFVPGDSLQDALRLAARRGVQVDIAIPARSNHALADFVRSRSMRPLARAGVRFRMLPFMAHAKAVIVDDDLAMAGSINLDQRSLLLNHEAAVVFYDPAQIEWLAQWVEAAASAGENYRVREAGLARDLAEGLLLTLAFQL
ncbi:MAG: phospholipase [Comamonadaceae bacterium]|nr:MAG: phospholipase [Comamonadaceae bacterium]